MGVRHLDVRVALGPNGKIYLSHFYLSTISLESVLGEINTFITANPGEILIVRIYNDNEYDLATAR